jgi:hypothetical protein
MPSTRSQAVWRQSPKTAFVSRMRPNDADKAGKFTRSITMCDWRTRPSRKSILRYHAFQPGRDGDRGRRSLSPSHCSEDPDSWPAVGAADKGAKRPARPLRAGTAAGRSYPLILLALFLVRGSRYLVHRQNQGNEAPKVDSSGFNLPSTNSSVRRVRLREAIRRASTIGAGQKCCERRSRRPSSGRR